MCYTLCTEHGARAHLVSLDASILADDARTAARRVQQHTVEPAHDLRELAPVVRAHDDVLAPQAVDVRSQTLRARLVQLVREDDARVLHERGHVRRLASGRTRHVEHALARLGAEGDDGEERRRGLQHVVACEVLRRGADGDRALEDLQTDVRPLADRLEVDATVDEGLCEVSPPCAEGVRADGDRSRDLVSLEKFDGLCLY